MASSSASVVESLARVHADLRREIGDLRAAVRPAAGATLADVRARLGRVRERIAEHFRLEEQDGYMDVVRQGEPRLEQLALRLAAEHPDLLRSLDDLARAAREATTLDARLRDGIDAWVERLRRHEDRENQLIGDAFDLDIGPAD